MEDENFTPNPTIFYSARDYAYPRLANKWLWQAGRNGGTWFAADSADTLESWWEDAGSPGEPWMERHISEIPESGLLHWRDAEGNHCYRAIVPFDGDTSKFE